MFKEEYPNVYHWCSKSSIRCKQRQERTHRIENVVRYIVGMQRHDVFVHRFGLVIGSETNVTKLSFTHHTG